jgi:streptogramin lyase
MAATAAQECSEGRSALSNLSGDLYLHGEFQDVSKVFEDAWLPTMYGHYPHGGSTVLPSRVEHSVGPCSAVAVNGATGDVYYFQRGANIGLDATHQIPHHTIVRLDRSGKKVGHMGSHAFIVPKGLHVDPFGALWATDCGSHMVVRLDPNDGSPQLSIGSGKPGDGEYEFHRPTDVAVHPTTREVFVADGYGNARVIVHSYEGDFLREWGQYGTHPGEFIVPHSITIDASRDRVYVADRENGRVQTFDTSGMFVSQFLSGAIHAYRDRHRARPDVIPYYHHLSSVDYHSGLDVLAVLEGNTLTLRDPGDGCILAQHAASEYFAAWPTDAELADDGAGGVALYVAEINPGRLARLELPPADIRAHRRD